MLITDVYIACISISFEAKNLLLHKGDIVEKQYTLNDLQQCYTNKF